jgi:putative endonuclease
MLLTRTAIDRRASGARYESVALAHLECAGLVLIARNFNCRHGEIDLVMRDRDVVVFVEVRYRTASRFGDGVDSISAAKRAKLVCAASVFLAGNPRLAGAACRFDVLAIAGAADAPSIDWRQNAFEAC